MLIGCLSLLGILADFDNYFSLGAALSANLAIGASLLALSLTCLIFKAPIQRGLGTLGWVLKKLLIGAVVLGLVAFAIYTVLQMLTGSV